MPSLKQRYAGVAAPRFGDGAADDEPAKLSKSQKREALLKRSQTRDDGSSRVRDDELPAVLADLRALAAEVDALRALVDRLSREVLALQAQGQAPRPGAPWSRPGGAAVGDVVAPGFSTCVQWGEADGATRRR